jgi:flagellum-specific ATP synthase
MIPEERIRRYHRVIDEMEFVPLNGRVTRVVGLLIEGRGPGATVGSQCLVYPKEREGEPIVAEVVGFRNQEVLFMPYGETRGIGPGCRIISCGDPALVPVGEGLVGRVLDGLGRPLDGKGPLDSRRRYPLYASPPHPLKRRRIHDPLDLGIRAVNGLLTCGKGQRLGIFSGSGVGKSTLLGMMARFTQADVSVIALIGERGREVREFIERDLGDEGLRKSVVVVATSEQPPLVRLRGAFLATAIAEYFRDQGMDVLLLMDSLTRFAMAQREVGLSAGEPPTTKGYPPSVFTLIPRLLERAGNAEGEGSITGLYTVLVESDDFNEPISDTVRSVLDGHIQLSRELANRGHYPAIDVLGSISRVMRDVVDTEHMELAQRFISILAVYQNSEDLIQLGAYVRGSDPRVDEALDLIEGLRGFLRQGVDEPVSFQQSLEELRRVLPAEPETGAR